MVCDVIELGDLRMSDALREARSLLRLDLGSGRRIDETDRDYGVRCVFATWFVDDHIARVIGVEGACPIRRRLAAWTQGSMRRHPKGPAHGEPEVLVPVGHSTPVVADAPDHSEPEVVEPVSVSDPSFDKKPVTDLVDRLERLASLHQSGLLMDDELRAAKAKLLFKYIRVLTVTDVRGMVMELSLRVGINGSAKQGYYFAMVDQVDSERRQVVLNFVRVDEAIGLRADGLGRSLRGQFRRLWKGAFWLSIGETEDPRPAEELMELFEGLDVGMGQFGAGEVEVPPDLWLQWRAEGTWLRVSVGVDGRLNAVQPAADDLASQLDRAFGDGHWRCAPARVIESEMNRIGPLGTGVVHDVGQGSAVALLGIDSEEPVAYFDVGLAFGVNARTAPTSFDICTCARPTVILSHWHTDHWWSAVRNSQLCSQTWIVPRQKIGPSHAKLAANILCRGRLLVVKRSSRPNVVVDRQGRKQVLKLIHATGKTMNNSGLIMAVEDSLEGASWLLPGDASYDSFNGPVLPVRVLVATHHGGSFGSDKAVPNSEKGRRFKLVYSFGLGNSYGHPSHKSVSAHWKSGWSHHATSPPSGPQVRSTAFSGPNGARASVCVGWGVKSRRPAHLASVHGATLTT